MGKVFRLHKGADGSGWFSSKVFNDENLKTILTDGKEVSNSIPSPFARIDLVKEAFRWVSRNEIDGDTAQHKLVSEALDVGQILFYSDKFSNEIDIVEYKPKIRVENRFGEGNEKNKELASTLDVYWQQDAEFYNFDDADRLFFIRYNKQLIGATSPSSLFFSAPIKENLRKEVNLNRASGQFFGTKPVSLLKREWDFIEYLYLLAKANTFPEKFPEVYEYLDRVKEIMSVEQRNAINNLIYDSLNEYDKCHVTGETSNYCEVVGIPLHKAKKRTQDIERQSDFVIDSDFRVEGKKPLVLPNNKFSEPWVFTTRDVLWDSDNFSEQIPEKNNAELDQSTLPIQGDSYPWLSLGNFLSDTIVKVPYNIDNRNFVTASNSKNSNYLLPLTDTFFKYFSVKNVSEMLILEEMGQGTVVAKLKVKTQRGYINFEKKYSKDKKLEYPLYLSILPFIDIPQEDVPKDYTIGLIDSVPSSKKHNNYNLTCFFKGKRIEIEDQILRSPAVNSFYQKTHDRFDAIRVECNNKTSGFIIPNMKKYSPSHEKCHFAIDFGTTNTHIEYKIDSKADQLFEVSPAAPLWVSLLEKSSDVDNLHIITEETFERELIPYTLGAKGSKNGFPLRTALIENKNSAVGDDNREVFKNSNNYLLYEKLGEGNDHSLKTNLKWENLHNNINLQRLEAYIEYLIRLIYYKALSLNIDLSNVKITWYYPTSMSRYHRGRLSEAWIKNVRKIFRTKSDENNITKLPESVGPYFYYYKKRALIGLTISVDIGGGSTDVAVFDEGEVKSLSSFRFAGDAIFGDGYGEDPVRNGFVKLFERKAKKHLDKKGIEEKVLKNILEDRKSSKDFSSYLFSLSNSHGGFNYTALIKNEKEIKFVILLFHASIAYYVAKMMSKADYESPKNLLFSGTASKTVNILDSSTELRQVSALYKFFFDEVFSNKITGELKCELSDIPKELTCKGGLTTQKVEEKDYNKIFWLGGAKEFDRNINLEQLNESPKVSEIVNGNAQNIEHEIEKFYSLVDKFAKNCNLEDYFGISRKAYLKFKKTRGKDITGELKMGIRRSLNEQHEEKDEPVEETLFFYPLVSELSKLAFELTQKKET
jgi:hypothetical protein